MEFLVALGVIAFFAACVWIGLKLVKLTAAHEQKNRERYVEAVMRQDIRDKATMKKVAEKMLREAGETP